MKLVGIYNGSVKSMKDTPCKLAIYTDGKSIKVFEKVFYRNNVYLPNWSRNIILEKITSLKTLEERILSLDFKRV